MKVTLIFPNYLENFFILSITFQQSLGLAMIAAVLKEAGHDVHIIDATAERLNIYRLEKRVLKINPDVIGITTNIAFARKAYLTGKWFKKKHPRFKVMFGGPWATVRYDFLLKNGAADYVVIGEGERTVVELFDAIEGKVGLDRVKGIAYRDDSRIIKTPPRELIEDLDSLPFPAWELFPPPNKYFNKTSGKRFYPICTSRGCPLGCIHCSKIVHGYKLRTRSIENIIAELKYLKKKFNMNGIIVTDDNFNYD
ncbi:MAG: B12-binding domain-containing radical SAM protein, partial [Promethearchaeota archaeon]